VAVALGTPFISGKDSLNNEFRHVDAAGRSQSMAIPPSLLISALGQIDDVARAVTMDLKQPGNRLYLVGTTRNELGGSHFALVHNLTGGSPPQMNPRLARQTFAALHAAIAAGLVRACHDLSEGGLAVAAAEMAFAGALGAKLELARAPRDVADDAPLAAVLLFSESNTRFLCEVPPENASAFEQRLGGVPHACIGEVTAAPTLQISHDGRTVLTADVARLKASWQATLDWK
jgi:phosphoribosylformylglycinamidine synthase